MTIRKHFNCYGFECNILSMFEGMYAYSITSSNGFYLQGFIETNEENEPIHFVKDLCRDIFLETRGGDFNGCEDY